MSSAAAQLSFAALAREEKKIVERFPTNGQFIGVPLEEIFLGFGARRDHAFLSFKIKARAAAGAEAVQPVPYVRTTVPRYRR